jgi:hypothetical protein
MKKTQPLNHEVERQLLPRLRLMGFLLMVFGVGVLVYGIMTNPPPLEETADLPLTLEKESSLIPTEEDTIPEPRRDIIYLGVSSFWVIGVACIVYAWRRGVKLKALKENVTEQT